MKYFDKNFFKFTLGFLVIVSASLLVITLAAQYSSSKEDSSLETAQLIRANER